MSPRYGYAFLLPLSLMLVAAILAASFGTAKHHAPTSPLVLHAPCLLIVDGPTPLYGCSDGHGWTHQNEGWVDAGLLTRPPPLPAN